MSIELTTGADIRGTIHPSTIGRFIKLQQCDKYVAWEQHLDRDEEPETSWIENRLSPLLSETGIRFEYRQLDGLFTQSEISKLVGPISDAPEYGWDLPSRVEDEGIKHELWGDDDAPKEEKIRTLKKEIEDAYNDSQTAVTLLYQVPLTGQIRDWRVSGDADIVILDPLGEKNQLSVQVLELKSSKETQTSHAVQAVTYGLLVERLATEWLSTTPSVKHYVITRSNDLKQIDLSLIDPLEETSLRTDVRTLLESDGPIAQALLSSSEEPSDVRNKINPRCDACPHHNRCFREAVESAGLELLGLDVGDQERMAQDPINITDLTGFEGLYDFEASDLSFDSYGGLIIADDQRPRVQALQHETGIRNPEIMAQLAYGFLSAIEIDGPDPAPNFLAGMGRNLVADTYPPKFSASYPQKGIVRVYLYVQEDYTENRLTALGASVRNSRTGESEPFACISERYDQERNEFVGGNDSPDKIEETLLEEFFEELFEKIQSVAPDREEFFQSEWDDFDLDEGFGYLHLYCYTRTQRDALMRGVKRHLEKFGSETIRSLLSLRSEISRDNDLDQPMMSILREEFVQRHALRYPGFGVVQTVEQFSDEDPYIWYWQYTKPELPLPNVFGEGFFDSYIDISEGTEFIELNRDGELTPPDITGQVEDQYPVTNRYTTTLPLEYIWAAQGRLDLTFADGEEEEELVERFLYLNKDKRPENMSPEFVEACIARIAASIAKIEENISNFSKDAGADKAQIEFPDINNLELDLELLSVTAQEYLDLEFGAIERRRENHWRLPVRTRLLTGDSIALKCTETPVGGATTITGQSVTEELLLESDEGDDEDESIVRNLPVSVSEGDWMVMTRLTREDGDWDEIGVDAPSDIGESALVIVSELDRESGEIELSAPWNGWSRTWPHRGIPYMLSHANFLMGGAVQADEPPETDDLYVADEELYILDPSLDQYTSYRANGVLEHPNANAPYNWLAELLDGNGDVVEGTLFSDDIASSLTDFEGTIESFLAIFGETLSEEIESEDNDEDEGIGPNPDQEQAIRDFKHKLVTVQGPPGTGKTDFTTAPALLARVFAFEQANLDFTGCASAVSHDAVDEIFEQVVGIAEKFRDKEYFSNLRLVRIHPGGVPADARQDELIAHVNYHEEDPDDFPTMEELHDEYLAGSETGENHLILFGPPTSIRGAVDDMAKQINDIPDLEDEYDYISAERLYASAQNQIFDFAIVDEASMISLPMLFLAGAFLRDDGQMFLAGDHRQIEPIQSHEWESEDRRTIEETVPFLSALNFIRFLRGDIEEEEYIVRKSPQLDAGVDDQRRATLPMYGLQKTYRLPDVVAQLLRELFYRHDKIELEGVKGREKIPETETDSELIETVLNPESRVSVITYDSGTATQVNKLEAEITRQIMSLFDIVGENPDEETQITAGAVVPYRAQRNEVTSRLPVDSEVQVDTVESFQGGQRDLIVLSMTSSDPGHVNGSSSFLGNPNKFNVAISRMRRKVIIIASKPIFQLTDPDFEEYTNQASWKYLYEKIGATQRDADFEKNLSEIDELDVDVQGDPKISVYNGFEDEEDTE